MMIIIRCETCGESSHTWNQFNYNLSAKNPGYPKRCETCNQTEMKGQKSYNFWFCSRKCLEEYLKSHQENDYKHLYEKV